MDSNAKILVTGGSGYIAGFAIRQLLAAGWTVRTTIRNLSREQEVRSTLGGDAADRARLTFTAADLSHDRAGPMPNGVDYVLQSRPPPANNPKDDQELIVPARRAHCACCAPPAMPMSNVCCHSSTAAVCYG